MNGIKNYILKQVAEKKLSAAEAKNLLTELGQEKKSEMGRDIAIIGIACRLPGAKNTDGLWENLVQGVRSIGEFPEHRKTDLDIGLLDRNYVYLMTGKNLTDEQEAINLYCKGGYLDEIDRFDAAFFNMDPTEAAYMDPFQRLVLETSYHALEDAGLGGANIYGARAGVFVGRDHTTESLYRSLINEANPAFVAGSWTGILASRISYMYNLKGPSMVVDTACSSGLVAVHSACNALQNKECDLALAGGIHISYKPLKNELMDAVTSQTEEVRTFDAASDGTVWSEGVGMVVLKPLNKAIEDGDNIHAVIKGSAINNDGASFGITAPDAKAQQDVIQRAWEDAGIHPETIDYIEAHGSGTLVGDPIEVKGISTAFKKFTQRKQFCGIGSVKPNIGHSVAASGIAALIKVILALENGVIPPTVNFDQANPLINFCDAPVYLNNRLSPWKKDVLPRRAGVNSMGYSGTNCHVVLEEKPRLEQTEIETWDKIRIFTISAKNKDSLMRIIRDYDDFFTYKQHGVLDDICYTANTGRGHYNYRIAFSVTKMEELKKKISDLRRSGVKESNQEGIYFRKNDLTEDGQGFAKARVLASEGQRKLNQRAAEKIGEINEQGNQQELLEELCEIYVQGADIDWKQLYSGESRKRVSLPVYPFERIRCWIEQQSKEKGGTRLENVLQEEINFDF